MWGNKGRANGKARGQAGDQNRLQKGKAQWEGRGRHPMGNVEGTGNRKGSLSSQLGINCQKKE